ncbi:MAG: hypothetical protein AB8B72_07810 [Crocinitomicaceae bacterium]
MRKWIQKYSDWIEGIDPSWGEFAGEAKSYLYLAPLFLLLLIGAIWLMTL